MLPVAIVKSVPSNVRFDSAVIALVPVPVNTALSVREDAPVPPLATDKSVPLQSPIFTVSLAAKPLLLLNLFLQPQLNLHQFPH